MLLCANPVGGFAFRVWHFMCHNCSLGFCIVAHFVVVRIPQTPLCVLWLQGSNPLHALSSTGSFSNCGTCSSVKTPVFFILVKVFSDHSVLHKPYGVLIIQGLVYMCHNWYIVAHSLFLESHKILLRHCNSWALCRSLHPLKFGNPNLKFYATFKIVVKLIRYAPHIMQSCSAMVNDVTAAVYQTLNKLKFHSDYSHNCGRLWHLKLLRYLGCKQWYQPKQWVIVWLTAHQSSLNS